jgi:hypothetical protein
MFAYRTVKFFTVKTAPPAYSYAWPEKKTILKGRLFTGGFFKTEKQ